MPNIKSAEKRVKVTQTRTMRNKAVKTSLKTDIKKFDAALKEGDLELAQAKLRVASGALDSAARRGTIHKNKANRKKSRLAKALNKAQA